MADSFSVSRPFTVPAQRVFDAFTTPELFAQWWGTSKVEVPLDSVAIDARPGGSWKATMQLPDGNAIDWSGEYTEVEAPTRLAFTLKDDPSRDAGAPVEVDIEETDGGSRLTLTQTSPDFSPEQVQATVSGYTEFFDDLAAAVGSE